MSQSLVTFAADPSNRREWLVSVHGHDRAGDRNDHLLAEAAKKAAVFAPPKLGPTTRLGAPPNAALWFADVGDAETVAWA